MANKITNDGTKGGLLKGKSHDEGGVKAIVVDANNKPVELEKDEVIITKKAVADTKERTLTGTNVEILSEINQSGGGVPIVAPNEANALAGKEKMLYGGKVDYFIENIDDSGYDFKYSMEQVYKSYINGNPIRLSSLIKHDLLFKKYPKLKLVLVYFGKIKDEEDEADSSIEISAKNVAFSIININLHFDYYERYRKEKFGINGERPECSKEAVLLHEIQHLLQQSDRRSIGQGKDIILDEFKERARLGEVKIASKDIVDIAYLTYKYQKPEQEAMLAVFYWLRGKGLNYGNTKYIDWSEHNERSQSESQKGIMKQGGKVPKNLTYLGEVGGANDGGIIPPIGELKNANNYKLNYVKNGKTFEFHIYKPITSEVGGYNKINYSCTTKDCSLKMEYNQFVNYLYTEGYIDDVKNFKEGGAIEGEEAYNKLEKTLPDSERAYYKTALERTGLNINLARTLEIAERIAKLDGGATTFDQLSYFAEAMQYTMSEAEGEPLDVFYIDDLLSVVGSGDFPAMGRKIELEIFSKTKSMTISRQMQKYKKANEVFRTLEIKHRETLKAYVNKLTTLTEVDDYKTIELMLDEVSDFINEHKKIKKGDFGLAIYNLFEKFEQRKESTDRYEDAVQPAIDRIAQKLYEKGMSAFSFNLDKAKKLLEDRSDKQTIDEHPEKIKEAVLKLELDRKKKYNEAVDTELQKGISTEQEHKETFEKVAEGKIGVEQAIEETAKEHIKENPSTEKAIDLLNKAKEGDELSEDELDFVNENAPKEAGFDFDKYGDVVPKSYKKPKNFRPIFWQMTMDEFCEYAENYEVDTRLDGTKAALECKDFYRFSVILPLLHETAERNVFLLAVETNQMPYDKVVEIIKSAKGWDENNKKIKQLLEYNQLRNFNSNIWKQPKDLYLSSDYFKNKFTKAQAESWYSRQIYKDAILDDKELHDFLQRGIVKFKDVMDRTAERSGSFTQADQKYIDKLKRYSDKFNAKRKLKALYLLIDDGFVSADESMERHEKEMKYLDNKHKENQAKRDYAKGLIPDNQQKFMQKLFTDTINEVSYNKVKLEKTAKDFGITNQNLIKELAELVIVLVARRWATWQGWTPKERYEEIVKLYKNQVNLSHRTSESILLQQYSTPAPLGYLMGLFCGVDVEGGLYFEPSAGNGQLTVAGRPKDFIVNEIDETRNRNLQARGFKEVLKQDASEPFTGFEKRFDCVITNPPFGKIDTVTYGKSEIKSLEQVMALRALDCMKDNGRAAIIIGGHTEYDKEGRIQAGKNRIFFVYLYRHYNVVDVINISGRDLYSRQGTAFNTRIILINGRKETPSGFPPLIESKMEMNETESPTPVTSFEVLWDRISKQF